MKTGNGPGVAAPGRIAVIGTALLVLLGAGVWLWHRMQPGPTVETRVHALLQVGDREMAALQVLEAEQRYQEALKLDPDNPDAWYKLAMLYTYSRRNAEAMAAIGQWLARVPPPRSWPLPLLQACRPWKPAGFEMARKGILESLRRDPKSAVLHADMATLILFNAETVDPVPSPQRLQEVDHWLQQAAALGADDSNYFFHLANLRLFQHRTEAYEQALKQAVRLGHWRDSNQEFLAKLWLAGIDLHHGQMAAGRGLLDSVDATLDQSRGLNILSIMPVREVVLLSRHVYFDSAIPLAGLKRWKERLDFMGRERVSGPASLLKFHSGLDDFYAAIASGNAAATIELGTGLIDDADAMRVCASAMTLKDHLCAMIRVEIGDELHRHHQDGKAAVYYARALAVFPYDAVLKRRLAAVEPGR